MDPNTNFKKFTTQEAKRKKERWFDYFQMNWELIKWKEGMRNSIQFAEDNKLMENGKYE